MNLFRSEEHIRNWPGYVPGTEQGLISLELLVKVFSGNFVTRRQDPDYVSNSAQYVQEFLFSLSELGPFWASALKERAA